MDAADRLLEAMPPSCRSSIATVDKTMGRRPGPETTSPRRDQSGHQGIWLASLPLPLRIHVMILSRLLAAERPVATRETLGAVPASRREAA